MFDDLSMNARAFSSFSGKAQKITGYSSPATLFTVREIST